MLSDPNFRGLMLMYVQVDGNVDEDEEVVACHRVCAPHSSVWQHDLFLVVYLLFLSVA